LWVVRFCPVCGDFQRRRQHLVTTVYRALPVCDWPALGMPWCTAMSSGASVVYSRCGRVYTRGCGRAGQAVLPVLW